MTGSLVGIQYVFYEENYSASHFCTFEISQEQHKIHTSDQPMILEICPNVSHMINSRTETEDFKSRNPILWTAGDLRLQTMDPATKLHCTCNMSGMTCCMVVPQKTTIFLDFPLKVKTFPFFVEIERFLFLAF